MKRLSVVLAIGVLTATVLAGCVVMPLGGWYVDGGYYRGGGYYHYHAAPYRPYYHSER